MRQALEARLVAAKEIRKVVEQEKLDKEEYARRYFAEQQDLMKKVVQESKQLQLEAEENSKDHGRARGFGFVVFADPAVAERVVMEKHQIDGRTVEAKKVVPMDDQHILNRNSSSIHGSPVHDFNFSSLVKWFRKTDASLVFGYFRTATKVSEMLGNVDTSSALSAFEKMEEKVLAMESQAEALNQLTSDDLEGKFALLESSSIDDDLASLKKEASGSLKHYLVGIVDEIDALSLDLASFLYLESADP
ncbi:hypothetical protein Syun_010083 [Stephania yunnanensis]|uniref:RRM domain-containing protein n=1 Tax=Stephania yunnanensis TaxID=152371 RepID=A0AAP0KHQ3_9MAGN